MSFDYNNNWDFDVVSSVKMQTALNRELNSLEKKSHALLSNSSIKQKKILRNIYKKELI